VEVKIWIADFSFGCIRIDGGTYDHDVVIDAGQIRERKKKLSEKFRDGFGHIPSKRTYPGNAATWWLEFGAYGRLPVMKDVKR
jgi:hypothetical protein